MNRHDITLRYFDARGRVQFIRDYMSIRGVAYTDERVPLSADFSAWLAIRDDATRTGPFRKLPVLEFDREVISETLVIVSFLHERLGDRQRLSAIENRHHEMLASSLYTDILVPVGTLIWADRMFPGTVVAEAAQQTLGRVRRLLSTLNTTLEEWGWLARSGPETLADCLLWDQIMTAVQVFGKHLGLGDLEALSRFYGEFPAREKCLKMLELEPCPITARPGEAAMIEVIRTSLDIAAKAGK